MTALSFWFVRKVPFSNVKTGELSHPVDEFFNAFKAAMGQQLNFGKVKRLIVPPPRVLVFGILLCNLADPSSRKRYHSKGESHMG